MSFTDYSVNQVCQMYGENKKMYVRDAIRKKKLPGFKQFGQWYIKERDLDKVKNYVMGKKRSITI